MSYETGRPEDARPWWGPGGRPRGNTPLIPAEAASPVMVAMLRLRARTYLHTAVGCVREARETGGRRRTETLRMAERHLGVAEGQVMALYDTGAYPWNILRAIERVRRALGAIEVA